MTTLVATLSALTGSVAIAQPIEADALTAGARLAASTAGTRPVCEDPAHSFIGGRWTTAFHWTFNASSTPSGMNVGAAEAVLIRSFNNITRVNNDCGRPDKVSAQHVYDGRNPRKPNVSKFATCNPRDGKNALGFGILPRGVLAATCTRISRSRIIEADIKINSRYKWALSVTSCVNRELLEPTMTHEIGHVYGLGHVKESRHPLLTMSAGSDGLCNNAASTLGWGDILGLQELY